MASTPGSDPILDQLLVPEKHEIQGVNTKEFVSHRYARVPRSFLTGSYSCPKNLGFRFCS